MNYIKDKKILALAAILLVFTIAYFIIANKISYAFVFDYDTNKEYDVMLDTIKQSAIAYGENNPELFKEKDTIYIKVQDLIDNNYLITNETGNIYNPLKEKETMNSNMIKIKLENEEVSVEVDS